jgi:hypothetical protein
MQKTSVVIKLSVESKDNLTLSATTREITFIRVPLTTLETNLKHSINPLLIMIRNISSLSVLTSTKVLAVETEVLFVLLSSAEEAQTTQLWVVKTESGGK